jgi:hypothetical protein
MLGSVFPAGGANIEYSQEQLDIPQENSSIWIRIQQIWELMVEVVFNELSAVLI